MGRPFARGVDPRRGRGPAKGAPNAGRPPDEHRAWCAGLISEQESEAEVRKVLRDSQHPAYATMWKALADRGYGKPMQSVELSGPGGGEIPTSLTLRFVRPDGTVSTEPPAVDADDGQP